MCFPIYIEDQENYPTHGGKMSKPKISISCSYDELVKIGELKIHPKNNNMHPDDQIRRLAKIIEYQGIRSPIVVSNRSGFITKGHGRLLAFKLLKISRVPVNFQDYENESQEYADLTADNEIARWAKLDMDSLIDNAYLLKDLDLDVIGIKDLEIPELGDLITQQEERNRLEEEKQKAFNEKEDEVPDVKHKVVTQLGDIWLLNDHRVMCGDSTSIDKVNQLMGETKASMVFTDPPYNQSFSGGVNANGEKSVSGKNEAIKNDKMKDDEYYKFCLDIFTMIYKFCTGGWYISFYRKEMVNIIKSSLDAGLKWRSLIIWKKNRPALSPLDFHNNFEPILYGYQKHDWYGGKNKSDVWEYPRPTVNDLHPTMKPIELIEHSINNSSLRGGVVMDLFLGSGSTLIACDKINRKCYGMELDEKYCDVIVTRWQNLTGKNAILERTGKTFNSYVS